MCDLIKKELAGPTMKQKVKLNIKRLAYGKKF